MSAFHSQMCFEWFTKGQHDLESDVQQQLFKEKILKLESYEITMNGKKMDFSTFGVEICTRNLLPNPSNRKLTTSINQCNKRVCHFELY